YQKMDCAHCHGELGQGVGGIAPSLLNDPRKMQANRTPIMQFAVLYYGIPGWDHPAMINKLSVRETWDLVFYVRSFTSAPLTAVELQKLEKIFGTNCADCHGEDGYGDGPLGHNLEPLPANFHQKDRFLDREDSMLWNHIANGLYPSAMPSFIYAKDRANDV